LPVRWRRANRSEPQPEPGAEVTYDWPEGGGAPFDTAADDVHWVLLAGSKFGRTWPAGDLRDFGSWTTDFEKRVRMGYKGIAAAERLAVVDRGDVVREWPATRYHPAGTTFVVADGLGGRRGPDGAWISHAHDSYDAALAEASSMMDRQSLVVRVLVSKDWH
jgi:hypothetical protein